MFVRLTVLLVFAAFLAGCSKPGRTIISDPSTAAVFFNDILIGKTPLTTETPPAGQKCWPAGYYKLEKEGYKKKRDFFRGSCEDVKLNYTLDRMTTITREITSTPEEAMIYFGNDLKKFKKGGKNEVELGQTPFKDKLDDDTSSEKPKWEKGYYRFQLKGFRSKIIEMDESGKDLKLHIDLVQLPRFPEPPRIVYPDPKQVIIQDVNLDTHRDQLLTITPKSRFAIIPFKDAQGQGAGSLMADSLILHLKKMGYDVVDRETIDKVMKEQGLLSERMTEADDKDLANKLGKILSFDFLIVGAITDYSAKSENVYIAPEIPKEEWKRYEDEYGEFVNYYTTEFEENLRPKYPLTVQQWELEYATKAKSHYLNIARIGMTSKIIAVDSTKIMWIGLANTTHMNLQEGTKRIVAAMVKDFSSARLTVEDPAPQKRSELAPFVPERK
jgi:hypothetical protein